MNFQDELSNEGEGQPNVVEVPISVIILDENDNAPAFRGTPYKAAINEDTPVGTTVFRALEAVDADLVKNNALNIVKLLLFKCPK